MAISARDGSLAVPDSSSARTVLRGNGLRGGDDDDSGLIFRPSAVPDDLDELTIDDLIWRRVGGYLARTPYEHWGKPVFDRVAGLILLLLALPFIVLAVLWARPQLGPGGPLFRQQRIGRGGRPFTIYKLRTMRTDRRTEQLPFDGPDRRQLHKSVADPRHTRRGQLLRRSSIDELPQLWNVVKGEMSLVGPRPEMLELVMRHHLLGHPRHLVKPGLTGPWQISADRMHPLYRNLGRDVAYLLNVTFWSDLRLLVRTAVVMARAGGH